MYYFRHFFILILLIILSSCNKGNKVDNEIISREKLVEIIYDLQISYSLIDQNYDRDSIDKSQIRKIYEKEIFEKHKISPLSYEKSIIYYAQDLDSLIQVTDKVIQKLE